MKQTLWFTVYLSLAISGAAIAQDSAAGASRQITLQEAVQLAIKHNHIVRIAEFRVEEKKQAKNGARSLYFPILRNDSTVVNVSDSQFVAIPAGVLGGPPGSPVPARTVVLNQGGRTFTTSGTQLTQPLTQLLKFKPLNDIARAEVNATRSKARQAENDVALKVHQLYYKVLIAQVHRSAIQARIRAAEDLQNERVQQVKYGSTLQQDLIDSHAQYLQARQDLLTTELQLSDLTMQLNDVMGLPLGTQLGLDTAIPEMKSPCERHDCVEIALESHPEILEARQEVEKTSAGVRLAKAEYVPDISAFARESYQNNVPFLARNFGSFGLRLGYDLFDGGRKRSALREREAQMAQARENLARVSEEVELGVQTAYNKLQRTREMVKVSEELLALRSESSRVSAQQLERGVALKSQAESAIAQELDAKTALLQSRLDYIQAHDEMIHAMGRTPE